MPEHKELVSASLPVSHILPESSQLLLTRGSGPIIIYQSAIYRRNENLGGSLTGSKVACLHVWTLEKRKRFKIGFIDKGVKLQLEASGGAVALQGLFFTLRIKIFIMFNLQLLILRSDAD